MKLFLYFILTVSVLFSFGGKIPPPNTDLIISYQDKSDRSIGFIRFDNLSTDTNQSYLENDIPKTIALSLQNSRSIIVNTNHLFPKLNYSAYLNKRVTNNFFRYRVVKRYLPLFSSNDILNKSNVLRRLSVPQDNITNADIIYKYFSNEVFSFLSDHTNVVFFEDIKKSNSNSLVRTDSRRNRKKPFYTVTNTITNFSKSTNVYYSDYLTNKYFFFSKTNWITNVKTKRITSNFSVYLYKSNINYITPDLTNFSMDKLLSNQYLIINSNYKEYPNKYILQEQSNFIRKLVVQNKLYSGSNYLMESMISRINADYIVYGSYLTAPFNDIKLKVFLINRRIKSVKKIYDKKIKAVFLSEEIAVIPKIILAEIMGRRIVENVRITSTPSDAYVYVDNNFLGNTPLTIVGYPEGAYSFRLWYPAAEIDFKKSFSGAENWIVNKYITNNNIIISTFSNRAKLSKIIFEKDRKKHNFYLSENSNTGTYTIDITNDINASFYLNSGLIAVDTNIVSGKLICGDYFLNIVSHDMKPRSIKLPITHGMLTTVSLAMFSPKYKSATFNRFFNHKRNVIIWSSLGASFATLGSIAYFGQSDFSTILWDKFFNSSVVGASLSFTLGGFSAIQHFLSEEKRDILFRKIWNYDRNMKIFGFSAVLLTTLAVYNMFKTAEYRDKYMAEYESEIDNAVNDYLTMDDYLGQFPTYVNHRSDGYMYISLAGISMTMSVIFRILDIKKDSLKVDFQYKHGKDVNFKITKSKEF